MIISHKYKFIFIKTNKTAGTSVEVFLSQICGAEDIVTPFGVAEPGHRPRNHQGFFNHISAEQVINRIGARRWEEYFTFCFERNPWDKAVSHYWFSRGKGRFPADWSFDQYLHGWRLPLNFPKYSFNGAPIVDFVGRYECLEEDLQQICDRLGIGAKVTLPRAKATYRKNVRHYSTYYDDAQRDFIAEAFVKEIALLGYEFEDRRGAVYPAAPSAL